MTPDAQIQTVVTDALANAAPIRDIHKMHGDASYRVYYRVSLNDGSSYIVMQLPAGKASASEEITNFSGKLNELPFQNVQHFLAEHQILVPQIIHYNPELHMMLLEDCGDVLLLNKVDGADDSTRSLWYRKAIDLLCDMQSRCGSAGANECVALQRSFDDSLLNWEFNHFIEYGIEARRGEKLPEKAQKQFTNISQAISNAIMELPYGFTHRDYQSRNLLVRNDELIVIDFQDALRGPFIYDVVSLLRDSYVDLSEELLHQLIGYYAEKKQLPLAAVQQAFDYQTVQRKLKDAGRFVYIDRVKGNPNYLKFIPTSLQYVRSALSRLPQGKPLFDLLQPFVSEWH